ncbi:MAG TPA: ABC transporter permease subunit [Blastocatellia bacterium]|jgi:Cu-processing system permease protein|nr:ABC transporter permease subunit [Blastocatellia bacterium]
MDLNAVRTIARQELVINIRNRWTLIFAGVFGVLVLAISYFGLVTAGETGFQGFGRTSASLLNLVLYIIPLVSLTMGTLSFSSASELLFSQPVTRTEILLGKLAGLFCSILTATLFGFGLAGIVIGAQAGAEGSLRYPLLVLFSLWLALIFLSLSALITALCRRKTKSFGVALVVWFFFVLFYDLLVIGGTFLFRERTANTFLFGSLFGNPVDIVRVASLIVLDGEEVFGAAGAALLRFVGGEFGGLALLVVALWAWVAVPFFFAQRVLRSQDI